MKTKKTLPTQKISTPTWQLKDINYALVETARPPMYTAMKYWGKKPHNIWGEFIESYCPPGGVVLDTFAGSAIAAFEAVKIGRKAICFDLNPLTSFVVEALCASLDEAAYKSACNQIFDAIELDTVYTNNYLRPYKGEAALVYNYRWNGSDVVKLAVETAQGERCLVDANAEDKMLANQMASIDIPFWYPTDKFPSTPSITHKFSVVSG